METNKGKRVVKKIIKQQPSAAKKSNSSVLKDIAFVAMFIMVFVIFVRGFNIKSTVNEQNVLTRTKIIKLVETKLQQHAEYEKVEREMLKNEILSAYALYSRLSVTELKEKEEYHQQQVEKWEKVANSQVTKDDIHQIQNQLHELKDTTKNDGKEIR